MWLFFGLQRFSLSLLIPWLIGHTSRFEDRVAAELLAWTSLADAVAVAVIYCAIA